MWYVIVRLRLRDKKLWSIVSIDFKQNQNQ